MVDVAKAEDSVEEKVELRQKVASVALQNLP